MSWREEMKIANPITNEEVLNYLKQAGFKPSTMKGMYPESARGERTATDGKPCMELSKYINDDVEVTICINDKEAVSRTDNGQSVYFTAVRFEKKLTMGNVDQYLDELF